MLRSIRMMTRIARRVFSVRVAQNTVYIYTAQSMHPWITPREASELTGVHTSTLARWAAKGHLRVFVTPGGQRRYHRADVEHLVAEGVSS